jgi:hypothetical protein
MRGSRRSIASFSAPLMSHHHERMTMTNLIPRSDKASGSWRTQSYLIGAAAGLLFGLFCSYMYTRAATDLDRAPDGPNRVQTGDVLGLALASLAVVRQAAAMGQGPEPKKSKRR